MRTDGGSLPCRGASLTARTKWGVGGHSCDAWARRSSSGTRTFWAKSTIDERGYPARPPRWRGLGIAARILGALEDRARHLGAERVVLETGDRQRAALALYEGHGYKVIAPFGEYVGSPHSVCMEKRLGA